jgi:hypothetical protein
MALDVLSIPASSRECERMFSELGDLLEPHRRNISPQLLSAIQCVRRWRRAGLGTYQSQGNTTVKDEELDLLYGVQSWANSSFNGDDNSNDCSV